MTYEEACQALGYSEPPSWMSAETRELLIATAEGFSENGARSIDSQTASRIRAEVDMFG